jgi:hypothetical protein
MKQIGNKSMQTNFPLCVNVSTYSKGDKSCLTCLKKERSLELGTLFDVDIVEYKKRARMF